MARTVHSPRYLAPMTLPSSIFLLLIFLEDGKCPNQNFLSHMWGYNLLFLKYLKLHIPYDVKSN